MRQPLNHPHPPSLLRLTLQNVSPETGLLAEEGRHETVGGIQAVSTGKIWMI